jgi:type II secretory pathway pseudopilin PulG
MPTKVIEQIQSVKSGAGFTLIEVLVYIGLFTLLVGTLLGVAYQTIAATSQINKKIVLGQEADFILRKIDWALTGDAAVSVGTNPSDATITRYSPPSTISFRQNGNFIGINSGMGEMDLNSANVVVSNLVFLKTSNPPQPDKVWVGFGINCLNCAVNQLQHFEIVKHLRK